jgi:hypothetical protein
MSSPTAKSVYKAKDSLVIRKEAFGGICYSREVHAYELINDTAFLILQLCDGKRQVAEIVSSVCNEYEGDGDLIKETVLDFIKQMEEKGYITKAV